MGASRTMLRLLAGWGLLLVGVLILLDSSLPVASRTRSQAWLGVQAVVGFGLAIVGWWLRRQALRSSGKPK